MRDSLGRFSAAKSKNVAKPKKAKKAKKNATYNLTPFKKVNLNANNTRRTR